MSSFVVVDKVAVGHVSQALAVAMLATFWGDNLVGDKVWEERGSCGGWEAHVGGLHRSRPQSKDLVPGSLHPHFKAEEQQLKYSLTGLLQTSAKFCRRYAKCALSLTVCAI